MRTAVQDTVDNTATPAAAQGKRRDRGVTTTLTTLSFDDLSHGAEVVLIVQAEKHTLDGTGWY